MTAPPFIEDTVEQAALAWLGEVGYSYLPGPDIAPGEHTAERESYHDVILDNRLAASLRLLNPSLPHDALDEAQKLLLRAESPNLAVNNHRFHKYVIDGVPVSYQNHEGRTVYKTARVVDFDDPANNDWLAVNQFSILKEGVLPQPGAPLEDTRRPDIILFVNGLPLVVIELKNIADESATAFSAYKQLQTYKQEIPALFTTNASLIVSDGNDARMGALTSGWEWFKAWKTIDGEQLESGRPQLEVLIKGALAPDNFLQLIRYSTIFETRHGEAIKKIASYHQFHAARKAADATSIAVRPDQDGRIGVIWHTQGSGKSLTMLFYAGRSVQDPTLKNPTLVVLTDRNDLDNQLFGQFALGHELLRQKPVQAQSRADLREKLEVAAGGVVFTTIQKFLPEGGATEHPMLSDRRNIVFIVDEAHRTQYGFEARFEERDGGVRQVYGLAKYMRDALPNASFIGFTGTPISLADKNTRNVFGEYLDIYDIQRAVQDEATVPIYYEARHAKLKMDERMAPTIDPDFEEITEGEEDVQKEFLKTKWAQIQAVVGEPDRLRMVARDIVNHYEARDKAQPGKAMIVCMAREICVRLYGELISLKPEWHHEDDDKGALKVVMTGSAADGPDWQQHIRNNRRRKALAERFRDPDTGFKVVIVRDMWLTGFDAPSLHTMYADKPMRGHNLMQAIARVNRVYPHKDGGLVVAYLPLQSQLQEALKDYTEAVVKAMFFGFDYSSFFEEDPARRLTTLTGAVDHILAGRERNRDRYIDAVTALGRAFGLANPHDMALAIRDEVGFFQAVKAALVKTITTPQHERTKSPEEIEKEIRDIVDRAVAPEGVIDLFDVAGLPRADISILSDEFLIEVEALPRKNVAVELLRRLIEDEIRAGRRKNLVQSRSFEAMLRDVLKRYNEQKESASKIINRLIELAKEMREAQERGEELGLTDDELAFYDALEVNDSAVAILGDEILKEIAQELVKKVRANVSIDWTLKESAQARMRVIVKRILRNYGYPPDKQITATETVVAQAELLSSTWAS